MLAAVGFHDNADTRFLRRVLAVQRQTIAGCVCRACFSAEYGNSFRYRYFTGQKFVGCLPFLRYGSARRIFVYRGMLRRMDNRLKRFMRERRM